MSKGDFVLCYPGVPEAWRVKDEDLAGEVDYRELLKKYMRHVINQESYAFLPVDDEVSVTQEEQSELRAIHDEIEAEATDGRV